MFDEIAKNVMTKRKNFGAPDEVVLKEMVESKNLKAGTVMTIDFIIARNKTKKDKNTGEVMKSKKGNDIYQTVVYIAFDGDKFTATKSPLVIEELKMITKQEIQLREVKDIRIDALNGKKVKVAFDKVRYGNDEEYDNIIFVDA